MPLALPPGWYSKLDCPVKPSFPFNTLADPHRSAGTFPLHPTTPLLISLTARRASQQTCPSATLSFFFLRRSTRPSFALWADTAALALAILKDGIFLRAMGHCGARIGGFCCSCLISKRHYLECLRRLVLEDNHGNADLRGAHHRIRDFDQDHRLARLW